MDQVRDQKAELEKLCTKQRIDYKALNEAICKSRRSVQIITNEGTKTQGSLPNKYQMGSSFVGKPMSLQLSDGQHG